MARSSSKRNSASAAPARSCPRPSGPEEQEAADGAVGIAQARPRAPHRVGHGHHRLALTHHALAEASSIASSLAAARSRASCARARPSTWTRRPRCRLGDLLLEEGLVLLHLRAFLMLSCTAASRSARDLIVLEAPGALVVARARARSRSMTGCVSARPSRRGLLDELLLASHCAACAMRLLLELGQLAARRSTRRFLLAASSPA
jgi:hypothetical protein